MNTKTRQEQPSNALIETIAAGFQQIHHDNEQREAVLKHHYELELKIQHQKNVKWKIGAYIATFAIVAMGYTLHKTISIFEGDMNTMSAEIVNMSGYMKSMSTDISTMNGNIGRMAPDMNTMSIHIKSIDQNMGSMKDDMGQMNNAMSPLMFNMQKFVPGGW